MDNAGAVVRVTSWGALVEALTSWVTDAAPGVFETVDVVVARRDVARLTSQALAAGLPTGMSAGIRFLTAPEWVTSLAEAAAQPHVEAWDDASFPFTVAEHLARLAPHHTALGLHLQRTHDGRPGPAAQRVAPLLRLYLDHAPDVLAAWVDGRDVDADGHLVAEHLRWQPALVRSLLSDVPSPLEARVRLLETLHVEGVRNTTAVLPLLHVTGWTTEVIRAVAAGSGPSLARFELHPEGPGPHVTVHESHDPARQAEVLRDELTRCFDSQPGLQPRDAIVVSPASADVRRHLPATFRPADVEGSHPGRTLRLEAVADASSVGSVPDVLMRIMGLPTSRATSGTLVQLLSSPPVATRWGFDAETLTELVQAADIRWGVDARHRAAHHLSEVTSNTWQRGLDKLLVSVAVGDHDIGLPVTGVATVSASSATRVGHLAEVVSRIRRFMARAATPLTPTEWYLLAAELVDDLLASPLEAPGQAEAAAAQLRETAASAAGVEVRVGLQEARSMVAATLRDAPRRTAVGNGNLHVVEPGALWPAGHRVVAVIGIEDQISRPRADEVPMRLPDQGAELLKSLVASCVGAETVHVITRARTAGGEPVARPTVIGALCRALGVTEKTVPHPASSRDPEGFAPERPSYDAHAATVAAVAAGRRGLEQPPAPELLRRRTALTRAVPADATPVDSLDEVVEFLRDPAAWFLRSTMGVRIFTPRPLEESMALEVDSMLAWNVRKEVFQDLCQGMSLEQAKSRLSRSDMVPPAGIGRCDLDREADTAMALWQYTKGTLNAPVTTTTTQAAGLRGSASLRGSLLADVSFSTSLPSLLRAALPLWVAAVGLAAQGTPVRVALAHPVKSRDMGPPSVASLELTPPPQEESLALLTAWRDAATAGRHRLIPVPLDPALEFLTKQRSQWGLKMDQWAEPPTARYHPWLLTRRSEAWRMFFTGPAGELFTTPLADAPTGVASAPEHGAFGTWATVLHGPMVTRQEGRA